jgi:phosphatidylinositol glycan class B
MYYGSWTAVPLNFARLNLQQDISSFYGQHPWHWYLSQGIPVVIFTQLPFTLHGLYLTFLKSSRQKAVVYMALWTVGVYSVLKHKEFRFMMPLAPVFHACAALSLSHLGQMNNEGVNEKSAKKTYKTKFRWIIMFLCITNSTAGIYLTSYHQRGVVDVMLWFRKELRAKNSTVENILFLMPCHSTPYHSMLHDRSVKMRFLTCEPPIGYNF